MLSLREFDRAQWREMTRGRVCALSAINQNLQTAIAKHVQRIDHLRELNSAATSSHNHARTQEQYVQYMISTYLQF